MYGLNDKHTTCTIIDPATGETFNYAKIRDELSTKRLKYGDIGGELKSYYFSWPCGRLIHAVTRKKLTRLSPEDFETLWKNSCVSKPFDFDKAKGL